MKFLIFIGNPRTGHSLVGAIIDAHKDAVVSHELNAISLYSTVGRDEMVRAIKENSVTHARAGKKGQKISAEGKPVLGYSYQIPGLYQGIVSPNPVLLGDKRGFSSTEFINAHPGFLGRFSRKTGFDLRLIHVIRNPYDTLATWSKLIGAASARDLFRMASQTVSSIKSEYDVLDVYLEDLIVAPEREIQNILQYLGLETHDDYVKKCTAVVFNKPNCTRYDNKWEPGMLETINGYIQQFEWLGRYKGTL